MGFILLFAFLVVVNLFSLIYLIFPSFAKSEGSFWDWIALGINQGSIILCSMALAKMIIAYKGM